MSTFFRTFQSSLWSHKYFRRLAMDEQFTYIFLLTGEITSDTGLYPCVLEDVCRYTRISLERMEEIFEKFEKDGKIIYDRETEEILVCEMFTQKEPLSGIKYEHYVKDFSKIESLRLIKELAEISKNYNICMAFFAALQDLLPDLKEEDYMIKKTEKTAEVIRGAAARGRKRSGIGISAEERTAKPKTETEELLPWEKDLMEESEDSPSEPVDPPKEEHELVPGVDCPF